MEAVACEPAVSAAVTSAAFSDIDASPEDDAPAGQAEIYGLCAHGHCQHGPHALFATASADILQPTSEVRSVLRADMLELRTSEAIKRPPRL